MLEANRVRNIKPEQVEAFLYAQGWQRGERERFSATWLKSLDGQVAGHVAVPLEPSLSDYGLLLSLALDRYASYTDVRPGEVLEDLAAVNHDTVRVRLEGGVHEAGRAKLATAHEMVRGVRDMFFSGAVTIEQRQPVFQGRSTNRVEEYIESLEIAAPERGSFVVKVFAPVAVQLDRFGKVDKRDAQESFGREATASVLQTVDATIIAAEDAKKRKNLEIFKDHVKDGVSANMCEALASISTGSPLVSVSVGASWASSKPAKTSIRPKTVVPAELLPFIEQAAPILRGRRPEDPITVIGLVFLLKEERKVGSQAIAIENRQAEGPRKVRVALSHGQYKRAIQAAHADAMVKVTGQVRRKGPVSYIDEPLEFEVLGTLPPAGDEPARPTSSRLDEF